MSESQPSDVDEGVREVFGVVQEMVSAEVAAMDELFGRPLQERIERQFLAAVTEWLDAYIQTADLYRSSLGQP